MPRNARTGEDRLEVEVHPQGRGLVSGKCRLQWPGADGVWKDEID